MMADGCTRELEAESPSPVPEEKLEMLVALLERGQDGSQRRSLARASGEWSQEGLQDPT